MLTKRRAVCGLGGALFIAAFAVNLAVASDGYTVVNRQKDFYFGHVSFVEETEGPQPFIVRDGDGRQVPALVNTPLVPGDTIVTPGPGRLELQFDNGTILRLDSATEMKIETILAESLTSWNKMTNLVLRKGRVYAMFKEYSPREICQFVLPTAAVRLRHQTVAVLGVGENQDADVRVRVGKAEMLYGPDVKNLKKQSVFKGERMTIGTDHRYLLQPYSEEIPFEVWNVAQNAQFEKTHKGASMLPKPVRKWPAAVQFFAEKYADLYGEWVYDDYLGYVWRPAENDHPYGYQWFRSGAGGWKPFFVGHWTNVGGQMFWVPDEPWGWIPYHLGVWHWNAKYGWLWVPGSVFAPAWVDWYYADTYFAWLPSSFMNWLDGSSWMFADNPIPIHKGSRIINQVSKDQLVQPDKPTYQMPKEYKGIIKNLQAGLVRRDPALLASFRMQREAGTAVSWDRLAASRIQELAFPINALPAAGKFQRTFSPVTPRDVALRTSNQFRTQSAAPVPTLQPAPPALGSTVPSPAVSPSAFRIHDWNPDARLAARFGFSVRYNSRSNLVYSPELRMRSGDRWLNGSVSAAGLGFIGASEGNFSANGSGTTVIHGNTSPAEGHSGSGGGGGGGAEKK